MGTTSLVELAMLSIGIIGIGGAMMVAVVSVLTRHRRQMEELRAAEEQRRAAREDEILGIMGTGEMAAHLDVIGGRLEGIEGRLDRLEGRESPGRIVTTGGESVADEQRARPEVESELA